MSSKYLLSLALLLCNGYFIECIDQLQPNAELYANASSNLEHQQKVRSTKFKMKFVDMNLDVLIIIVNQMDLPDVINFGSTNWEFHTICAAVFRQRYRDFDIRIVKADQKAPEPFHVNKNAKFIEIRDSDRLDNVFRIIGKWIQKLTITTNQMGPRSKLINEIVNEYTSPTLTHLDLRFINSDTFKHFTLPFDEVEVLHFVVDEEISTANTLPFNRTFPKLCKLFLNLKFDIEHNFLDCTLPNLEHITARISYSDSEKQKQQIGNLLQKNAHIKSVNIVNFPDDYVSVINECLPNLQNLTLDSVGDLDKSIHFENLTHLQLFVTNLRAIDKLKLPNLRTLEMNFRRSFDELITFFRNHQHLTDLKLHIFGSSTYAQLNDITAVLPNLVTLELIYESKDKLTSVDVISQIMQRLDKVVKIQFPVDEMKLLFDKSKRSEFRKFRKQFDKQWHVKDLKNVCVVEKRTPDAISTENVV